MDWTIDYSPLPVYVRVATGGMATAEGSRVMWDEILNSEHWVPGTSVLFRHLAARLQGTEGYRLTQGLTRYFAEKVAEIGDSCLAVILVDSDVYHYLSQFQYAIRMRGSSVIVRSFTDEQTAIEWLEAVYRDQHAKKSDKTSAAGPTG
jgi:hypothetical protein